MSSLSWNLELWYFFIVAHDYWRLSFNAVCAELKYDYWVDLLIPVMLWWRRGPHTAFPRLRTPTAPSVLETANRCHLIAIYAVI